MRKNIRLIFIFFLILILKNLAYADILKEYWKNAPSLKEFPGVSAIVLLDEITAEVEKDGSKTIIEHEIIKLCDKDGIERFAKIYYYYLKNFQEVNLERAAVINEDGEEYALKGGLIKEETPLPKSPLFSNIKFKTIILPQVKIGSIIEYKIKLKEKFPQIYKNFWTASFLSDFIPILDSRFILKVPKEINFNYKIIGEEKISPEKTSQGDYFYYKWKFNNSSKIPTERAQLPSGALSSKILISTIPSWDYLASWCYKLFKESAYSDKAVKKLTLDLTKDKKKLKDKVKSLYDYIKKEIKALY
ncbi:MAG: DUF3857 domain-containing protein [Armatimonadetes bacterium]|nr:DUF3857 domain-containing protein [Armatimonadota bacterium]